MQKNIIQTDQVPVTQTDQVPIAIGAYSPAVKVGNTVYLSGQIPLDPKSGQIVSDSFFKQAEQVFANLSAVANANGGSLINIVKLTIYLTDLSHFSLLNDLMEELFSKPYPARAVVQVSALPKGAKIEIDAILCLA